MTLSMFWKSSHCLECKAGRDSTVLNDAEEVGTEVTKLNQNNTSFFS